VLYFPGCGASLFYRSIGMATVRLLLDAGISVVLPPDHLCCGYPLLASGCSDQFERLGANNQKALSALIRQAETTGFVIKSVLTSCGTCREGVKDYRLKSLETKQVEFFDVVQFLIQHNRQAFENAPDRLLYHAACHHEWTGVAPLKAAEVYARELGLLLKADIGISPHCCGESGLGALTSPKIYNRLRARKKEQLTQDITAYTPDSPIVVGCPSCKIGISRSLLEMDVQREVLHTTEFLAALRHGTNWRKNFYKHLSTAKSHNGVQTIA
jgi:Fe-S oxidoreductase